MPTSCDTYGQVGNGLAGVGQVYHPAFGANVAVQETYIPEDPDGQVGATIGLMRRYVLEDAQSPAIKRDLASALGTTNHESLTRDHIVDRVFHFVKGRVTFMDDGGIAGMSPALHNPQAPVVEVLIRPKDMAVMCEGGACHRVGDCDDFSMYAAALLGCAGIPCRFVTVAADQAEPGRFSHVYVAAYPHGEGSRIAMDTSHGPRPGWETGNVTRLQEWPIHPLADSAGMVALGVMLWLWLRS